MSPDGMEVPVGKEGEVWIKGPNVFIGYLNNEAATLDSKVSFLLSSPLVTDHHVAKIGQGIAM